MKTVGIIAEYNPFHNGHAYQIKKIKELTQAEFVVVAMSGDFVQRGTPAIVDKYARARMALSCGADLVIELPVLWATSSAENFAMAGVTLFDKMGCVDGLCFGAETDDLSLLSSIADILVEEPEDYRSALSSYIKQGMTFPLASAKALSEFLTRRESNELVESLMCRESNELAKILNSPNNILAIEYLKALRRIDSKITPILIKREGAGYHETVIHEVTSSDYHACSSPGSADAPLASASGIRKVLLSDESFASLAEAMPDAALSDLKEYCRNYPLMQTDDFSSILGYRLLLESPKGFAHFYDANTDISNRIAKNRHQFLSFSEFCERNKSRDITYSRMNRILLHILLGLTNEDAVLGKGMGYIPYLRLLGFRRDASALLTEIKNCAQVPMLSKLADAGKLLGENALRLLEQDIFAAELYEQVLSQKKGTTSRSEYTRKIVLI